jgi:hypothetical protein
MPINITGRRDPIERMPSEDRLRELLFGRRIVNVEKINERVDDWYYDAEGRITLDDGTVLLVGGNTGGCSCGAGDYDLTTLNTVDNAITNVIVEERPDHEDKCSECGAWSCDHQGWYRIFVVAEDHNQHLVASFEGSDGNGYYGTGWWLTVVGQAQS